MGARRFFVQDAHAVGDIVPIDGSDAHKILHVLRLRNGEHVEIVDSSARLFDATLRCENERVEAELTLLCERDEPNAITIDVAQGIPKGPKMDFVVEKLTELGVNAILPIASERAIAREVGPSKLERWRRLAKSAAQQSGRREIPQIAAALSFDDLIDHLASYDLVLFAWEVADPRPLRETLPALVAPAQRVLVAIGPEGGFSHDEAERARAAGAHLISLGSRILRTESAAIVVLSILQYLVA